MAKNSGLASLFDYHKGTGDAALDAAMGLSPRAEADIQAEEDARARALESLYAPTDYPAAQGADVSQYDSLIAASAMKHGVDAVDAGNG